MLFDEPTSSLDPELTGEVLNVMRGAGRGRHDDGGRLRTRSASPPPSGQRIAFLDHGRLILDGRPQEVFKKPRHPRLEQFLDTYLDRGAAMLL